MKHDFELGDSCVQMTRLCDLFSYKPKRVGTVTARSDSAVRISYKGLFGIRRNRWFAVKTCDTFWEKGAVA